MRRLVWSLLALVVWSALSGCVWSLAHEESRSSSFRSSPAINGKGSGTFFFSPRVSFIQNSDGAVILRSHAAESSGSSSFSSSSDAFAHEVRLVSEALLPFLSPSCTLPPLPDQE